MMVLFYQLVAHYNYLYYLF